MLVSIAEGGVCEFRYESFSSQLTEGAQDWKSVFDCGKFHLDIMTKCKLYANGQPGQVPGGSVGKHEKARIPFADA